MGFLLYRSISILLNIIEIFIVIRIFISFLNFDRPNFLTKITYEITEPILGVAGQLLSKLNLNTGFLDFTPLIAMVFISLIRFLIARVLL